MADTNDSTSPEFWDERYARQRMPWDLGGVPLALKDFLSRTPPGSVLIPGCGTGYEVRAFARAGWRVDALDFSHEAVRRAQTVLGDEAALVRQADFFNDKLTEPVDLIYERTFLCSLPKERWPDYAAKMNRALRSGGCLAGFFFFGPEPEPPPFPLGPGELSLLLGERFRQIEDSTVSDSLPLFQDKERWQVWRKS